MELILIFGIVGICMTVLTMAWASYLGWVTRRRDRGTEPLLESTP
jgi:hypothetical protein